jgi:hypothetical protein
MHFGQLHAVFDLKDLKNNDSEVLQFSRSSERRSLVCCPLRVTALEATLWPSYEMSANNLPPKINQLAPAIKYCYSTVNYEKKRHCLCIVSRSPPLFLFCSTSRQTTLLTTWQFVRSLFRGGTIVGWPVDVSGSGGAACTVRNRCGAGMGQ